MTPPHFSAQYSGGFRRYAVRKGSVCSTQKFCYIVRRHQFLLLKGPIFIKKHNKRDIQNKKNRLDFYSRARFARAFSGHFVIYKFKHLFWEVENEEIYLANTKANICQKDCTCASNILSFNLFE